MRVLLPRRETITYDAIGSAYSLKQFASSTWCALALKKFVSFRGLLRGQQSTNFSMQYLEGYWYI